MWCAHCQADVAAEVTADNRRIRCATCGSTIENPQTLRAAAKTREARELLERWSSGQILDPFGPVPGGKTAGDAAEPSTPRPSAKPHFRVDRGHELGESATAAGSSPRREVGPPRETRHPAEEPHRSDTPLPVASARQPLAGPHWEQTDSTTRVHHPGHEASARAPHFDLRAAGEIRKTNATAIAGQFLAYGGVLGLTIGTSLVVWGYFGGQASLAPTGWLITTAGQMLLFLGVVTLVSGGMEATTEEVARRIDRLGDKLIRIEQASRDHALRGPSIPAERFAPGAAAPDREHARTERRDARVR